MVWTRGARCGVGLGGGLLAAASFASATASSIAVRASTASRTSSALTPAELDRDRRQLRVARRRRTGGRREAAWLPVGRIWMPCLSIVTS